MSRFTLIVARDVRLALRRGAVSTMVVAFFVLTVVLFPLGVGPDTAILARITLMATGMASGARPNAVFSVARVALQAAYLQQAGRNRISTCLPVRIEVGRKPGTVTVHSTLLPRHPVVKDLWR